MPKRKQRKIHAPLKQDIQLYREMQKEKSPTRVSSPIPSTSSGVEQATTFSHLLLTALSEETLEELGLTSIHKKAKEKTKHLEPAIKKPRLDEEINLNLVTPEYLDISEQEFRNILNIPEKIFTLVQDEALGSDEWDLDDDLINMSDEEFEKIIENPNDLEDILNSALDENEKEEQQVKETVFQILLGGEKEIASSSKEVNINEEAPSTSNTNIFGNSEYDSDKDLDEEGLLEKRRQELRNKRTSQKRERELLAKLEEDLEKLKECEGEEFPSFLSMQIENEILLKRKKIKRMQNKYISNKKYRESEKGKETRRLYQESEKWKEKKRIYNQSEQAKERKKKYYESEKGKEARKRYFQSEEAKETKRRYEQSEQGKEARKRYRESEKGKESQKRYFQSEKGKETKRIYNKSEQGKETRRRYYESEKGKEFKKKLNEIRKQKRLEDKLRAESDPEFKKILDEKKRIKAEKDKIRYQKKKLEKLLLNNN